MDELVTMLILYLPRIAGAAIIVAAGLVLAVFARRTTVFLLRRLGFDQVCERIGVAALLRAGEIRRAPSQFSGAVVFYAVVLFATLAALGPLGLDFLAATLNQLILYAPRALASVLILILGTSAAGLLAEATGRALDGAGVARLAGLRSVIRVGTIFIATVLAAAVLGIDVTILIALMVIGLGAVALTAALALGLGLRGLSQNVAASRYVAEGIAEGDYISVNGFAGTVERIGHAVTTVRGANGRSYLVPNAYFLEHVVEKVDAVTAAAAD